MRPLVPSQSPRVDKQVVPDRDIVLLTQPEGVFVLTSATAEDGEVYCVNFHRTANHAIGQQTPDEDEYMYYKGTAYMRFLDTDPIALIDPQSPISQWVSIYRQLGYTRCRLSCQLCERHCLKQRVAN